jgi:tRNA 2-selenouridine synthase
MIQVEPSYDAQRWRAYDAIIDVRSPAEFADDHAPGAINLPVLSDAERAEVGAIYVQRSKFEARRLGAALIARNVSAHLQGPALAARPAADRLMVYCWRGGQRSGAMATILDQVGWRTAVLQGGYTTYRQQVVAALYGPPPPLRLVLLAGGTGTAKTELLHRVAGRGGQVLDLEGLAAHRGSLLGALPGRLQPPQKLFESRLWAAMLAFDPARPVLVEAESSKVGECVLPPVLWSLMQSAPRVVVEAPIAARAAYLTRAYGDLAAEPQALDALLDRLPRHLGHAQRESWRGLAAKHAWTDLAQALIEEHYDPAYARSKRKTEPPAALATLTLPDLGDATLAGAAERLAALLAS